MGFKTIWFEFLGLSKRNTLFSHRLERIIDKIRYVERQRPGVFCVPAPLYKNFLEKAPKLKRRFVETSYFNKITNKFRPPFFPELVRLSCVVDPVYKTKAVWNVICSIITKRGIEYERCSCCDRDRYRRRSVYRYGLKRFNKQPN